MGDLFAHHYMKNIISFSGGLGSAISAIIAWENELDFEMIFADTLIEDEDLYRFTDDIENLIGKKIIRLVDGRDPWDVFVDRKFIGNSRTAHCSEELKTFPVRRYMYQNFDPKKIRLILGMDNSEGDRIARARRNWAPIRVDSLINEFKFWRPKWQTKLAEHGIKPPRLYDYGFPHNNCGGMCVRGGLKQFATLLEHFPERFQHHEKRQNEAMTKIGPTAKPFLKQTVNYEKRYYSLQEFRERYEAGLIEIDPYDFGGCSCFVD